jgi:murein DD-endopeptidase MepM/ murein hydrolase activator NlpD
MIKPVKNGYITSDFDAHIARGVNGSFGYDIGSKEKHPVIYSSFQGIIISSGWSETFGNRVWIKILEGNYKGLFNVYPHLFKINEDIEDGVHINAGKALGLMGNTGKSFGDHLHFEIRTMPDSNGKSIRCDEIKDLFV